MIHFCQIGASPQGKRRRRFEQLNAQTLHPFSPVVGLGSVDRLPGALEVDLIHRQLAHACVGSHDGFATGQNDTEDVQPVSAVVPKCHG